MFGFIQEFHDFIYDWGFNMGNNFPIFYWRSKL
jgi:hypothetical protein